MGRRKGRSYSILRWSKQLDCKRTEQLLSHYFDGELPSDDRAKVEVHLEGCPSCSGQLAAIQMLSQAARSLSTIRPPHDLWDRIAAQLNDPSLPEPNTTNAVELPNRKLRSKRRFSWSQLATAVVLLIGVGMLWGLQHSRYAHDPLASYVQQFETSPLIAQEKLVAEYSGKIVSADQAVQLVGYRPRNVDPPPNGYRCDKLVMLDMPCCKCIQAVWQRDDQTQLAVFEHKSSIDDWFQGQPSISIKCQNKTCRVTELSSQLIATWQIGSRMVTVIGLRDVEELTRLVAALGYENTPYTSNRSNTCLLTAN